MPWEASGKASACIKPAALSAKPSMTACIHLYTRQIAILQEALVIHRFLDTFCRPGAASDSQSRIRLPA